MISRFRGNVSGFQIIVLNADIPLAFTAGGGIILISKGLLLKLHDEGELAFIVAHEIGHEILGHTAEIRSGSTSDTFKSHELEADAFALKSIGSAGYPPDSAIKAVAHSYRELWSIEGDHPSAEARIKALEFLVSKHSNVYSSSRIPLYVLSCDEFERIKKLLRI